MRAPLSDSSSSFASEAGVGAGVAGGGAGVAGAGGAGSGAGGGGAGVAGAGGAGAGTGVPAPTTMVTVFSVIVAASGTISLTTTTRPDAASFATKAVENAAPNAACFVGSASVAVTDVASARDVVVSS